MRYTIRITWRVLFCLVLAVFLSSAYQVEAKPTSPIFRTRPPLSYFALSAGLQAPLRIGARLSPAQFVQVQHIAEGEQAQLRRLLESSQPIVADRGLSLEQKRLYLQRSSYNRQVEAMLYASHQALRLALDTAAYERLISWMDQRWLMEVHLHGSLPGSLARWLLPDLRALTIPHAAPRTYEIFATRYDSKGRYTVALPDQCVKLTNGGLKTCADKGYLPGQRYEIFMSYKGGKKGVGVVVGETGPWNIDDNFWATQADPTPRRMFADLPPGMPEAQAAFYNGYNGGQDQYGRKVTAPFAIDLSFEVSDDLGLPARSNDWINVSFMWTESWGSAASQSKPHDLSAGGSPAVVSPVETAAFQPDGSQVHTVKSGETLWAIAAAYGVTLQHLRELNGLPAASPGTPEVVIVPGQHLIVRPAGPTPTHDPSLASTPASPSTQRTEKATRIAARNYGTPIAGFVDPGLSETATGDPDPPAHPENPGLGHNPASTTVAGIVDPGESSVTGRPSIGNPAASPVVLIIGGFLLAGLGLYLLGRWLNRA
jgi:LysM repeat protein